MRLLPLVLLACGPKDTAEEDWVIRDGSLRGRVCDPSSRQWLPDAMVYVNLYDSDGRVRETKIAYSDLEGVWQIDGLPGEAGYTYYVTYGPERISSETVWITSGADVVLEEPECLDAMSLDVAIVVGDSGELPRAMDALGVSYVLVDGTESGQLADFLSDPDALAPFDLVVFASGFVEEGVVYPDEEGRIRTLQTFVEEGGSLLAFDQAYDVVELAFPDALDFVGDDDVRDSAQMGDAAVATAAVTDPSLRQFLGVESLEIPYRTQWPPILDTSADVARLLTGSGLSYSDGQDQYPLSGAPLLVSFEAGEGKVVYGTFSVDGDSSEEVLDAMRYTLSTL